MLDLIRERIPQGLDEMEPGPELAGYLASIDVNSVNGYDRVSVLRAHKKMASHYDAQVYRDMEAMADALVEEQEIPAYCAPESAAVEVRAALTLTARTADVEMAFAGRLRHRFPRVLSMLMSGEIDVRKARTFDFATSHVSDAVAQRVVERVAHDAPLLTTGQLRARLQKLCIAIGPDDAKRRYESALEERKFVAEITPNGTVEMVLECIEPHRAAMATRRINRIARQLRRKGETRTMDQLRADVAIDLLIGEAVSQSARGTVEIRVDLETLCHLNDHPGHLDGYGPIIADVARQVADENPNAEWRFHVTDTSTNGSLMTGTTRKRPSAELRRHIESTGPTCVFPGCRRPSTDCDIDHITPWAQGGKTEPTNVAPLCRRDHMLRHDLGWVYGEQPDSTYRWTSPLGRQYITGADPP